MVDLPDPLSPVVLATVGTPGAAVEVVASSVTPTDPGAPFMVGALPVLGGSVDADGEHAFVQGSLLYAIDIRTPAQPCLV